MDNLLTLVINDKTVLQYDSSSRLAGHQRRFLQQMDADMDRGIMVGGEMVVEPDMEQRTDYVAMTLVRAALSHNDNLKQAACAYLGHRNPALRKIVAREQGEDIHMELVY